MTQFYKHDDGSVWFTVDTWVDISGERAYVLSNGFTKDYALISELESCYNPITSLEFFCAALGG